MSEGIEKWYSDGNGGVFTRDGAQVAVVVSPNDYLASDEQPDPVAEAERTANANLIASAPSLLDACKQALAAIPVGVNPNVRADLRVAITRATTGGPDV